MASMLHSQASVYLSEDDHERAYVQLKKFAKLYLLGIAEHNSYNSKTYQKEKLKYKRLCNEALENIKDLRKIIAGKHVAIEAAPAAGKTDSGGKESEAEVEAKQIKILDEKKRAGVEETRDRFSLLRIPSKANDESVSTTEIALDSKGTGPITTTQPIQANAHKPVKEEPVDRTHSATVKQQSSSGLRTVRIGSDLTKKFMGFASKNTRKNVETCGVLCGVLKKNEFDISACILPPQSGTANTTTTQGEEKLIELQESKGLLTLGW
eukprot:CAMPEP_0184490616 /NCGR_PEP_ID=MMETSP0113_2-20130426/18336_1 /TAXON_ID=91329 /ORGANISM="Norrisiella sphaerica, Strain BC52" /LENGTH=265 /DNA_ID=CAMNT_0026874573 /DNA_START=196 /DNA_END=990 /DNA_ORIENTATION=-